nr:hypothetical protein Iba_chr14bCG5410 [Ipomoea batatas]
MNNTNEKSAPTIAKLLHINQVSPPNHAGDSTHESISGARAILFALPLTGRATSSALLYLCKIGQFDVIHLKEPFLPPTTPKNSIPFQCPLLHRRFPPSHTTTCGGFRVSIPNENFPGKGFLELVQELRIFCSITDAFKYTFISGKNVSVGWEKLSHKINLVRRPFPSPGRRRIRFPESYRTA